MGDFIKTATNPKTGERFGFDGSQWVPMITPARPSAPQSIVPPAPTSTPDVATRAKEFLDKNAEQIGEKEFVPKEKEPGAGSEFLSGYFGFVPKMLKGVYEESKRFEQEHPIISSALPESKYIAPIVQSVAERAKRYGQKAGESLSTGHAVRGTAEFLSGITPPINPATIAATGLADISEETARTGNIPRGAGEASALLTLTHGIPEVVRAGAQRTGPIGQRMMGKAGELQLEASGIYKPVEQQRFLKVHPESGKVSGMVIDVLDKLTTTAKGSKSLRKLYEKQAYELGKTVQELRGKLTRGISGTIDGNPLVDTLDNAAKRWADKDPATGEAVVDPKTGRPVSNIPATDRIIKTIWKLREGMSQKLAKTGGDLDLVDAVDLRDQLQDIVYTNERAIKAQIPATHPLYPVKTLADTLANTINKYDTILGDANGSFHAMKELSTEMLKRAGTSSMRDFLPMARAMVYRAIISGAPIGAVFGKGYGMLAAGIVEGVVGLSRLTITRTAMARTLYTVGKFLAGGDIEGAAAILNTATKAAGVEAGTGATATAPKTGATAPQTGTSIVPAREPATTSSTSTSLVPTRNALPKPGLEQNISPFAAKYAVPTSPVARAADGTPLAILSVEGIGDRPLPENVLRPRRSPRSRVPLPNPESVGSIVPTRPVNQFAPGPPPAQLTGRTLDQKALPPYTEPPRTKGGAIPMGPSPTSESVVGDKYGLFDKNVTNARKQPPPAEPTKAPTSAPKKPAPKKPSGAGAAKKPEPKSVVSTREETPEPTEPAGARAKITQKIKDIQEDFEKAQAAGRWSIASKLDNEMKKLRSQLKSIPTDQEMRDAKALGEKAPVRDVNAATGKTYNVTGNKAKPIGGGRGKKMKSVVPNRTVDTPHGEGEVAASATNPKTGDTIHFARVANEDGTVKRTVVVEPKKNEPQSKAARELTTERPASIDAKLEANRQAQMKATEATANIQRVMQKFYPIPKPKNWKPPTRSDLAREGIDVTKEEYKNLPVREDPVRGKKLMDMSDSELESEQISDFGNASRAMRLGDRGKADQLNRRGDQITDEINRRIKSKPESVVPEREEPKTAKSAGSSESSVLAKYLKMRPDLEKTIGAILTKIKAGTPLTYDDQTIISRARFQTGQGD